MLSRDVDDGCLSPTCPIWYVPPLERREGEERPMAPSMAPRCLVSRGLHRLASLRAKSHARVSACVYRIIIDVTVRRGRAGEAASAGGRGSRSERSGPRQRRPGRDGSEQQRAAAGGAGGAAAGAGGARARRPTAFPALFRTDIISIPTSHRRVEYNTRIDNTPRARRRPSSIQPRRWGPWREYSTRPCMK
jgi:hypothetical protein